MLPLSYGPWRRQIDVFTHSLIIQNLYGPCIRRTPHSPSSTRVIALEMFAEWTWMEVHPFPKGNASCYARKRHVQMALAMKESTVSRFSMINSSSLQPQVPPLIVGEFLRVVGQELRKVLEQKQNTVHHLLLPSLDLQCPLGSLWTLCSRHSYVRDKGTPLVPIRRVGRVLKALPLWIHQSGESSLPVEPRLETFQNISAR